MIIPAAILALSALVCILALLPPKRPYAPRWRKRVAFRINTKGAGRGQ